MTDPKDSPTQLPLPQPGGPDVLAVIKDARADVARIKADADSKAAADAAALAQAHQERDELRKTVEGIEKAKGEALDKRIAAMADDKKALVGVVRAKLTNDELAAYLDKLAPPQPGDTGPAPGLPRGTDNNAEQRPGAKYQTKHKALIEEKIGRPVVHLPDVVRTDLPGAHTYSMPLGSFRERLRNGRGQAPGGKPTKA